MKKSEIFNNVIEIVSNCTEISTKDIVSSCRRADIVDARCIAIHWLFTKGFTIYNIKELFSFQSHNSVRHNITIYNNRYKTDGYFRDLAQSVANKLSITCQ